MPATSLRVAAVQMHASAGHTAENMDHATTLIERACAEGARLVVLPEFAPIGYTLSEELWNSAEARGGPLVSSLQRIAARLGIFLGTTILEAEGEHFYNTFVLATPDGEIAGHVRKAPPASEEAAYFRTGCGAHVIDCTLGRVGVQICYEVLLHERLLEAYNDRVDLLVQSAAAAYEMPSRPDDHAQYTQMVLEIGPHHALALGVPLICANRCGPIMPSMQPQTASCTGYFSGMSVIVDCDGTVLARADNQSEAVLVAEVHPGAGTRPRVAPLAYKEMWALPVPSFAWHWPQDQHAAELRYAASETRRRRAIAISSGQPSA